MIKYNLEMRNILKNNKQIFNKNNEIDNFCKEILNKTNLVHGCILYNIDKKEEKKLDFSYLLTTFGDLSYFEWYNNEILIPNEIVSDDKILEFFIKIKRGLNLKLKDKKICIVLDFNNNVRLLRFHIYREIDNLIIHQTDINSSETSFPGNAILLYIQD